MIKQIKKAVAVTISATMVFAMCIPAFAQPEQKIKFTKALLATSKEVKRELDAIKPYTDTTAIINNFKKDSYEYLLKLDLKSTFTNLSLHNSYKENVVENKALNNLKLISKKYANIEMNIYADNNKLAVNMPKIDDKYYYLNKNLTKQEWENSDLAKTMPFTYQDFLQGKSMINFAGKHSAALNAKLPDGFSDKYTAIIKKYIDLGIYKSEGDQLVETSRGMIATEKITCTIKAPIVSKFITEMSETIRNDKQLYAYFDLLYSSSKYIAGDKDIAREVINRLADSVLQMDIGTDIKFSQYISDTGYSIRNEVIMPVDDSTVGYLIIDLLGKDFLINEMNFITGTNDTTSKGGEEVKVGVKGDVVPKNGVFDFKTRTVVKDLYSNEGASVLVLDYLWDTTKTKNNIKLDVYASDKVDFDQAKDKSLLDLSITGTCLIDQKNNVIHMEIDKVDLSKIAGSQMSVSAELLLRPISKDAISVSEDKFVNTLKLTTSELEALNAKIKAMYDI